MIDRERLVADALAAVSIPSFTGAEEAMADWYAEQCRELGLAVQWQQVEDGRANVLATRAGTGGGPTLMFNGHMDTSYIGNEQYLPDKPGYKPHAIVEDGWLYGLGIYNMKGGIASFLHAAEVVKASGVPLKGDILLACVGGEIEKSQIERNGAVNVLEILDRYVYKTVADQRVARLQASMRASRRASSARRSLAATLVKAGRRLDPSAAQHGPCPDALPSRP